jgi:hypothetical protein
VKSANIPHARVTQHRRLSFVSSHPRRPHFFQLEPEEWGPRFPSYAAGAVSPISLFQLSNLLIWLLPPSFPRALDGNSTCSGCFDADAEEGDGYTERRANGPHNSKNAKDAGRLTTNDANNGQLQPTLPPLPELRPLEPLEPFKNMRRSVDPGRSSTGTTLKGREDDDGSAPKS